MHLFEKKLESQNIYDGKVIQVVKDLVLLENGASASREVVRHPGGVCVAALDEQSNVYFVRQFRYPYQEVILELPAGKLDRKGEEPLAAAKRELLEETGIVASHYDDLGKLYPSPGYCDEVIYLYAASGLEKKAACPDEDEFLDIVSYPLEEAVRMIMHHQIQDAKTQTAVLKLWQLCKKN